MDAVLQWRCIAIGNPFLTFGLPIALGAVFIFPALGLHHVSQSIIVFCGGEPSTQEAVKMVAMSNSQTELALQALSVMFFAPIAEELLFRGVIYTSIKQAGHPKLAIGFSAIIFAAIHGSLALMLPLAALAWALVWIYEKTGTIIAPILMHATFNAINFLECSLHSGGTPPTSCHAADGERDHGGVTHLVGLPCVLAGNEGDAAEPQEEEKELFHGLNLG